MSQPTDSASDSSDGLFARARTGDQTAWRELYDACYPKVLRVIRRKLNSPSMRSLYDSTDFVGDVWKSLAEKPEKFDFPTLRELVAFLSTAAERKVIDEHRRLHTLKHDQGRERPLGAWLRPGEGGGDVPSKDPTPSQFAQASEARERLLSGQTGQERLVLELKGQGYTNEEIAQKTGWHLRRVQRFLKDLGDSWASDEKGAHS
ncbi:MAG: hypothetical protein JWN86_2564 [Planctomycetota bacterium]|nr:hypothetical protein [Planctomycetota bacterium]